MAPRRVTRPRKATSAEDAADIKAAREAMKEPGEIPWESVKAEVFVGQIPAPVTIVSVPLKRIKIAVVGFASNTRDMAPYKDDSFEIWGLNNLAHLIPRYDRWFELHAPDQIALHYGADYVAFLKAIVGKPLYMQKVLPEYPASVELPRTDLAKSVQGGREFWPSSISYMLALAIHELTDPATGRAYAGAELGLYGIDLLGSDEYSFQREGCGYLCGVAEGRGIKLTVPEPASLLKAAYIYGYESGEYSPGKYEAYLLSQVGMYNQKKMEALAQAQTFDGAAQGFMTSLTMFQHNFRGGVLEGKTT